MSVLGNQNTNSYRGNAGYVREGQCTQCTDELAVTWLLAMIVGFYTHAFGVFMFYEIHSNILFLVIFEFGFCVPWINLVNSLLCSHSVPPVLLYICIFIATGASAI